MKKKCSKCYGYGIWNIGYPSPMGRMDAQDGMPNKPCPVCKSTPRGVAGKGSIAPKKGKV